MRPILFLLFLLPVGILLPVDGALPAPTGFFINCGATNETKVGNLTWIPDDSFITMGNTTTLDTISLLPMLSTLRYFPETSAKKYCYVFTVVRGTKYLVRTTYFYGNFDGNGEPPVFDQIIDGTRWSIVNTTVDYSRGLSTFYEIILVSTGKTMSVCLARNQQTVSSPFISALELQYLDTSLYNSTDFSKFSLGTVARHSFGHSGKIISYPDDQFNRWWQPFADSNQAITSQSALSASDFWNKPPTKVFNTALATERPNKTLQLQWPNTDLPSSNYYIALYFQDNRMPGPKHWRSFSITINGKNFYSNLNVSTAGVVVYANQWPLSGLTQIRLIPAPGSTYGPLINAGEVFQIRLLGKRTATRDVIAMQELARHLHNPPSDWSGDPCLPHGNSWTGVTCFEGENVRVITLNLTNFGLSGTLSLAIADLTALTKVWLGNNNLTGSIPDLRPLRQLVSLHLEHNTLSGEIPRSIGSLENLHEVFLYNNNLTGRIPQSLQKKPGSDIRLSPGNNFNTTA